MYIVYLYINVVYVYIIHIYTHIDVYMHPCIDTHLDIHTQTYECVYLLGNFDN